MTQKNAVDNDKAKAASGTLLDSLRRYLKPITLLLGSSTAIVALLLYSGFLSDFAVYRLAGLPRLSFSYTALLESGAEVLVDVLSQLIASPWRGSALFLLFAGLVGLWSYKDRPLPRRIACSDGAYQIGRLFFFVYAVFLVAGEIALIKQNINPTEEKQVVRELAREYAVTGGVLDPVQRQLAIERTEYRIPAFPFPNWAAGLERAKDGKASPSQDTPGIPLRVLAESRQTAAHVFGWLVFSLLLLVAAVALLPGWRAWQTGNSGCGKDTWNGEKRTRKALPVWLRPALDEPIRYLVAPATQALCLVAIALLPMSHGLLARSSLGYETAMVSLANPDAGEGERQLPRDPPDNAHCLDPKVLETMEELGKGYRKALRDVLQLRPDEGAFEEKAKAFRGAAERLVDAAIASHCPQTLQLLWELRPSSGVSLAYPELMAGTRADMARALDHYGVRIGTLLNYPRDGQPLTLIETLMPRSPDEGGQWALSAHEPGNIREIVVLPSMQDTHARKIAVYRQAVIKNPDSEEKEGILVSQSAASLAATLDLLENRYFHVSHAGAAVTALGGMAQANALERPDLARRAIDLLIDLASSRESRIWPEKGDNIRGAAATALHLTRNPYAAYRLAEELGKDMGKPCAGKLPGIHCVPQAITAAGFLLSDLNVEGRLFSPAEPPAIDHARGILLRYLFDLAINQQTREDERSAACSGLNRSGVRKVGDTLTSGFFAALRRMDPIRNPMAFPSCLNSLSMLRMGGDAQRQYLRGIFQAPVPAAPDAAEPYTAARKTAMWTLSELGLAGEADFMFRAYAEGDEEQREWAEKFMDEVSGPALGGKLLDCAKQHWPREPGKAGLCLRGFTKLRKSYDGDEGATQTLLGLLTSQPAPALKQDSCIALRHFESVGGLLARRWFKKHPDFCPSSAADSDEDKLLQLLRVLQASQKKTAAEQPPSQSGTGE